VAEGNSQIKDILCRLWLWSRRLGTGLPALRPDQINPPLVSASTLMRPGWLRHQGQTSAGHLVYLLPANACLYPSPTDSFHCESPKSLSL